MEKDDIPRPQRSSRGILDRLRRLLSQPYFQRSERRQRFQQIPSSQVKIAPMDYESLTLFQALKKWRHISWIAMAIAMNIVLWGFDSGIMGNLSSMPTFQ